MEIPIPTLVVSKRNGIDHVKTGQRMAAYRKAYRLTQQEVATLMRTPTGKKMSRFNLLEYERGRNMWSGELVVAYVCAVRKAANTPGA